jgi:hypothetical protein
MGLVLVPLVLVGLAVPATRADAAVETCFGMPATLVGTPGESLTGTEGPDVVVANGAGDVETLGGDDSVCVTRRGTFEVDTGTGDDEVSWVTKHSGGSVDLGPGSDSYTGGDQGSYVNTGDRAEARAGLPLGTDTVVTGSGLDTVITGHVSNSTAPSTDVIHLGAGRDEARVAGAVPATLDGGSGMDGLYVTSRVHGDWVVNGETGVLSLDGAAMPPATSFAAYHLSGLTWNSLMFRGGPGSELVEVSNLSGLVKNDGPFNAQMGGGNDKLLVRSQDTGPFLGGDGNDSIRIEAKNTATGTHHFFSDMPQDVYGMRGSHRVVADSIENLSVSNADGALVVGDAEGNRLGAYGCGNTVRGGPGNDRIIGGATKACYVHGSGRGLTAYGDAGNDYLGGGPSGDHLVGGVGRDKADGGYGLDHCMTETRIRCER